jgi:hypothetical protein
MPTSEQVKDAARRWAATVPTADKAVILARFAADDEIEALTAYRDPGTLAPIAGG